MGACLVSPPSSILSPLLPNPFFQLLSLNPSPFIPFFPPRFYPPPPPFLQCSQFGRFLVAMFYACLSILLLLLVILCCVCLSIIDLDTYNFGLYIVLLCIVGTMLACALCVANPNACPNPVWYSNFCLLLQEMYPSPAQFDKAAAHSSSEMNGIRSRMMAMQIGGTAPSNSQNQSASGGSNFPLRQESRATVAMLAPAVHIMHQVWRGMAWVADGIEEEEEQTKSYERAEQGTSLSCSQEEEGTDSALKKLSTIAETSSSAPEEASSEFASANDIMV